MSCSPQRSPWLAYGLLFALPHPFKPTFAKAIVTLLGALVLLGLWWSAFPPT